MGDYITHYVLKPATLIADAIAASAAVPGLIGPLTIRSTEYDWHRYKDADLSGLLQPAKRYELWTGVFMTTWAWNHCSNPAVAFAMDSTFYW